MLELLAAEGVRFDGFRLCLHHPDGVVPELAGPCDCRKPAPGMLLDAAARARHRPGGARGWSATPTATSRPAAAAGCRTVLVEHPGSAPQAAGRLRPDARRRPTCAAAAALILGRGASKLTAVLDDLDVKIFADGADLDGILALAADPRIAGFTTNPTLMWKAGLTDYEEFAKRLLERITDAPDLVRGVRRRRRRDAPPGAR